MLAADPADVAFAETERSASPTPTAASPCSRPPPRRIRAQRPAGRTARPLSAISDETIPDASFPYGCHVCEVEIDPDTGVTQIVNYIAVDDVGRAVNPMIVHGQVHGGIAQGVGQALWEQCVYDPDTGQLLTGSFMDYAMPRADLLPSYVTEMSEVPSPTHPLGIRPAGEGGTTPALGVVVNAVVDALAEFGVTHIEMPVTPERVWRAIREVPIAPAKIALSCNGEQITRRADTLGDEKIRGHLHMDFDDLFVDRRRLPAGVRCGRIAAGHGRARGRGRGAF